MFLERLVIPLIHFVLLGFLPLARMRASRSPAYAAGCGQLFLARREAYEKMGGHAVIRTSLHDGLTLPAAFRRAGLATDLFDATDVASCRMYHGAGELWRGLAKNATEGIAHPARIGPVYPVSAGRTGGMPVVLLAIAALLAVGGRRAGRQACRPLSSCISRASRVSVASGSRRWAPPFIRSASPSSRRFSGMDCCGRCWDGRRPGRAASIRTDRPHTSVGGQNQSFCSDERSCAGPAGDSISGTEGSVDVPSSADRRAFRGRPVLADRASRPNRPTCRYKPQNDVLAKPEPPSSPRKWAGRRNRTSSRRPPRRRRKLSLFFRVRPSVRRMMASCLLFGVDPLLALTPTEEYVDFDEEDVSPETIPVLFDLCPVRKGARHAAGSVYSCRAGGRRRPHAPETPAASRRERWIRCYPQHRNLRNWRRALGRRDTGITPRKARGGCHAIGLPLDASAAVRSGPPRGLVR